MKILFITSTRIGDAILSTSTLSYLMGKHPKAQVTIACGPLAAPLFEHVPGLKDIIVFKRKQFSYHWIDLWVRSIGTKWDIIVDLRGSAISYLLLTGKRYVWSSKNSQKHRVEQLADLLKLETPPNPTVWLGPKDLQKAEDLLPKGETFIGIGPAANWSGKEWPQSRFKQVIENLTNSKGPFPGATVLFFAAPHETHRIQPLIQSLKDTKTIDLSGKLELREVASCLKKCALYVGNDSGLMHLSAACGTPTIGLFGPSRVEHYAPWGDHTRFAKTDEPYEELIKFNGQSDSLLTSLPVTRVESTISDLLKKREKAS